MICEQCTAVTQLRFPPPNDEHLTSLRWSCLGSLADAVHLLVRDAGI
jgi:hypothetical protein